LENNNPEKQDVKSENETVKPRTEAEDVNKSQTNAVKQSNTNKETESETTGSIDNKQKVLNFWKEWLVGNGRAYINPTWLLNRFMFMLNDNKEARIANLGAGPMNMIGNGKRHWKIDVVASDPYADEYAKMRRELNLKPKNPVEKQDLKNLTYENESFDIVYSANTLNHLENPYRALQEMLRICKPNGYIYLRHVIYKGKGEKPLGEPKWDIRTTKSGSLIFKNVGSTSKKDSFALSDIYPGFITEIEKLPKGKLYTSFVKKS
jgi:SAM-dependent methyltransferase